MCKGILINTHYPDKVLVEGGGKPAANSSFGELAAPWSCLSPRVQEMVSHHQAFHIGYKQFIFYFNVFQGNSPNQQLIHQQQFLKRYDASRDDHCDANVWRHRTVTSCPCVRGMRPRSIFAFWRTRNLIIAFKATSLNGKLGPNLFFVGWNSWLFNPRCWRLFYFNFMVKWKLWL